MGNTVIFDTDSWSEVTKGQVIAELPALTPQWLRITAGVDPRSGALWLSIRNNARHDADRVSIDAFAAAAPHSLPRIRMTGLTMAADLRSGHPADHFDGRIENPRIYKRSPAKTAEEADRLLGQLLASVAWMSWDFSLTMSGGAIHDVGEKAVEGQLFNHPARAVTGHGWTHQFQDPRQAPQLWNAIHFHSDDLTDAEWEPSVRLTVPHGLPSAIYSLELRQGEERDDVPFYVTTSRPTAEVLFLAPTNTYLAYANEHLAHGVRGPAHESMMTSTIKLSDTDRYLEAHHELGLSLYDTHADGSGVMYSSRRRPILNMRPDYSTWLTAGRRHMAADFFITGWLERNEISYDVATDEDLHRDGADLLRRYRVVVTGSHPEYITDREYEAVEEFTSDGGQLMYLGANGFFWVTSAASSDGAVIECRRGYAAQLDVPTRRASP